MERKKMLSAVPIKNPQVLWEENKSGMIRIKVERKDLLYGVIKRFTGKVRIDRVPLDRYGSFIWRNIDGKHTIEEIKNLLQGQQEEEIENIEERIFQYFQELKKHQFIVL